MSHFHDEFETDRLKVVRYCIGPFAVNTIIIMSRETKDAVVVDPGGDDDEVIAAIKAMGAVPRRLLFTHCHIDHVTGAMALKKAWPEALVTYHELDQIVVDNLDGQSKMFGFPVVQMPALECNLRQEPEFQVGDMQFVSMLTPGHTPGSVVFYMPLDKLVLTGDLLFKNSVGRTDFEGGSGTDLVASLALLIKNVPEDTHVLPGHGRFTTMKDEIQNNVYLRINRYR